MGNASRLHQKVNWKQTTVFKTTDNLKKGRPGKTVISVARKKSLRRCDLELSGNCF
jgi:hypothetical protein